MFDWSRIERKDREIARRYIGELRDADYCFFPPNEVYQYRWFVMPLPNGVGSVTTLPNVYLHIMTGSDPTDELHDHNWHNTTHVLAGRAIEHYNPNPEIWGGERTNYKSRILFPGDVIYRDAREAHRLELIETPSYFMTLFAIGPEIRKNKRWKI